MRRLVSLPHFIVMKMLEFVLSYMIKINMILSFGFWFLFCTTPFSVAARAKCIVLPRRNRRRQGRGQWRNITSGGSMLCELAALACYVEAKGVLTGEGTSCQQRFWVANICLIRGLALTAAALMEFFSLKVVCAPLPLACCHQCVYPSFFQLPLFSVGSTGFWCSQDCGCGMVDWFCYTYHWSSCNYVVRRLPVGSQCRIAEYCIIKMYFM